MRVCVSVCGGGGGKGSEWPRNINQPAAGSQTRAAGQVPFDAMCDMARATRGTVLIPFDVPPECIDVVDITTSIC